MGPTRIADLAGERGASETLSVVLLFGIVIAGIGAVIGVGAVAIDDVQDENDVAAVEDSMLRIDKDLGSVANGDGNKSSAITARSFDSTTTEVVNETTIRFYVNDDPDCRATYHPEAIRKETRSGQTFVYESGAVWEVSDSGGFSIESLPDVTYEDGAVSMSLVGVNGSVSNGDFTATRNASASRAASSRIQAQLFEGAGCGNVNNFTVSVESPYDQGWGQALEREFGKDLANGYDDGDDTVTLVLEQDDLADRLNLDANEVVDFDSDDANITYSNGTVIVDKPSGTNYTTTAVVLNDPQVGRLISVEVSTTDERDPIDVIYALDTSGSMSWEAGPPGGSSDDCYAPNPGCTTKMESAKAAAVNFTGSMYPGDRVATVGWDSGGASLADGQGLTTDLTVANQSLDDISDEPGGGTNASKGLMEAIDELEGERIPSHEQVIILLSDGNNDGDEEDRATLRAAEKAASKGITVHTVAFGDANTTLMNIVSTKTGGESYTPTDATELEDAFDDIAENVITRNEVPNHPINMTLRTSGSVEFEPFGRGGLKNATFDGGNISDVNNPLGSTEIGYSFELQDGSFAIPSATSYDCSDYNHSVTKDGARFESACNATDTVREEINATSNRDQIAILADGADPSTASDATLYAWQTNLTTILDSKGLLNASGYLDLKSNQFVVAYDLSNSSAGGPGVGNHNNLVVLYEIGIGESEFEPGSVIRLDVSEVDVERAE